MTPDEPQDYLFKRLSARDLARAIIGDVRVEPTQQELDFAQGILTRTGDLFRIVAGFDLNDWKHKP